METLENAIHPKTRGAWRRWLAAHHARPAGVWLISYKQRTGKQQFDYNDAVEEPRKPRSAWAASNKARVERLIAAGLMTEAGLVKIEAAKRDGSWNTLDSIDILELPPDLRRAFRRHPGSAANVDAFPRGVKRSILLWISSAKRPETRAHRVDETAREAARNIRANQWRT